MGTYPRISLWSVVHIVKFFFISVEAGPYGQWDMHKLAPSIGMDGLAVNKVGKSAWLLDWEVDLYQNDWHSLIKKLIKTF